MSNYIQADAKNMAGKLERRKKYKKIRKQGS